MHQTSKLSPVTDEVLLYKPESYINLLGGLNFYGLTVNFRSVCRLFRDFVEDSNKAHLLRQAAATIALPSGKKRGLQEVPDGKKAIFLPAGHGLTTHAKAAFQELHQRGIVANHIVGGGASINWQQELDVKFSAIVIEDLPINPVTRRTVLEKLKSFPSHILLITKKDYSADEGMQLFEDKQVLEHIDERIEDKICWLIGLLSEPYRDESGNFTERTRSKLKLLPLDMLRTCCQLSWRDRLVDLPKLRRAIDDQMELSTLRPDQPQVSSTALLECFTQWISSAKESFINSGYRIFVEGETDQWLFELAAKLAHKDGMPDLLEGITILPLGTGRDGGTSQLARGVIEFKTNKHQDVFLFDNDTPGRDAQAQGKTMDQNCHLLPKDFSRTPDGGTALEIEIEDLISVDCLDRFYEAYAQHTPEIESLYYKKTGRRLVVRGEDKESLVQWAKTNATSEDLERILYVLCWLRSKFGLTVGMTEKALREWEKSLCSASSHTSSLGRRPTPWWYVVPPVTDV